MSGVTNTESHHVPSSQDHHLSCSSTDNNSGRALKLQTDTPHLVNIGGDRLSTSVTLHPIPPGRVTVGCGPGVDIPVHGTGVLPLHCRIENSEGVVTIYPLADNNNLSIDGMAISRPTRLSQGVMLTIGRSNYLRFNHPAEAKIMKSVLPNPRISMAPIQFEPDQQSATTDNCSSKFIKKPPVVPRKHSKENIIESGVEEPIPSSIMTKVSKFEYLAQQNFKKSISPKVFSANLVTVNTPAKDVLGKSPPDLHNFTKSLPQNVLNYSELNSIDKKGGKTPDRPIFGKKSPQYVNVAINEPKIINNRVIIYENGCIPKNQNVNLDHNELNNKTSSCNKNINLNKGYTRNHSPQNQHQPYQSATTPSPLSNGIGLHQNKMDNQQKSGSMSELNACLDTLDAEIRRTQAHNERLREQEIGKAEQARLEEILNMCVEYEKQNSSEKNKLTPNRIKTNGSLPRDKRQQYNASPLSPMYTTTPPPSPAEISASINSAIDSLLTDSNNKQLNSHSYENVNIVANYENVAIRGEQQQHPKCSSPYENVHLIPSPRTRIKTIPISRENNSSTSSIKDTAEIIENKFAILETEQLLLEKTTQQSTPTKEEQEENQRQKFIFPLDESGILLPTPPPPPPQLNGSSASDHQTPTKTTNTKKLEKLKHERNELLDKISSIKRQLAEIDMHKEELHRDIELEYALLTGETKSKTLEMDKLSRRKESLVKHGQEINDKMSQSQTKQEIDQTDCRKKLDLAQDNMTKAEELLAQTDKSHENYEQIFENYLKAQDQLDVERKVYEDLEFHHLEEEADWLATREEVQREIVELSKQIDSIQEQINELDQQKQNIMKNTQSETKSMKKRQFELDTQLQRYMKSLKCIETELSLYSSQESEQEEEESTDSDSDKSKELTSNIIRDMSTSVIVSRTTKTPIEHVYNMSQSFNEKLLQEKSILESGTKYPSQDDIDRFSKVTSSAPINIDEEQGFVGRKTIESLKDIERKRHLHLCQQGSQVIEQERQKIMALKQRGQEEARNEWAAQQRRQDCNSIGSGDDVLSKEITEQQQKTENQAIIRSSTKRTDSIRSDDVESPRPMSELSEVSVEYGSNANGSVVGTGGRRRTKPHNDKQRPLTRYLPIRSSDLDLKQHIESAGHQVFACPHVLISSSACRGFLHKKGSKLNGWSKRWFVFDRHKHTFTYYNDKSEKKPRGGAYFQAIEEVYLDHLNSVKSPNPQLTFIVKTHERFYYLLAPSPEAMRIWVDVIFTGAEGYQEFDIGT